MDLGARGRLAGRRYAAGLTGLFGPSQNFASARFARSGLRPPAPQRWAAHRSFFFWLFSLAAGLFGPMG